MGLYTGWSSPSQVVTPIRMSIPAAAVQAGMRPVCGFNSGCKKLVHQSLGQVFPEVATPVSLRPEQLIVDWAG